MSTEVVAGKKLSVRIAERYGVSPQQLWATLKQTAFRNVDVSNEQMMSLMIVADQYKLNPFLKELYAFPDKKGGIIPVVGVDGWSRIINEHPQFDGMDFDAAETFVETENNKSCPEWIECRMFRKDRTHPVVVREYFDECYRPSFERDGRNGTYTVETPWQTHPKRFLRHKTMIQAARLAFGFAGIYDPDESERIIEATAQMEPEENGPTIEDEIKELAKALGPEETKVALYRLETVKTPEALSMYRDALRKNVEAGSTETVDAEVTEDPIEEEIF